MHRLFFALALASLLAATPLIPVPASAQSRPDPTLPKSDAPPKPQIPSVKPQDTDPAQPARRAECAWIGQRIVSLLWRDDVNTAREQSRFYEMFGCPQEHLPLAFRCVIEQSETQPEQADLTARVYGCWMSPEARDAQ